MSLKGSYYYVAKSRDLENVALYLNFDMIGSPNFARTYYIPKSRAEELIVDSAWVPFFRSRNIPVLPFDRSSRSDHYPFQVAGIPTVGLFTGNDEVKTDEKVVLFGGISGEILDPCYHSSCDTIANVDQQVLADVSDATAHAVLLFANRDNVDFLVV
jgi:Zn-dependent M28 family amino/carboxypeptidase